MTKQETTSPVGDRISYHCSAPLEGDAEAAMELAKIALLGQGFQIQSESSTRILLKGPGMQFTGQAPLGGVSELQLDIVDCEVKASAILDGARNLKRWAWGLPVFIGVALIGVLYVSGISLLESVLWGLLPVVTSPLMVAWLEQRTKNAVESLLLNVGRAQRNSMF
jgi:hypothetical protein